MGKLEAAAFQKLEASKTIKRTLHVFDDEFKKLTKIVEGLFHALLWQMAGSCI